MASHSRAVRASSSRRESDSGPARSSASAPAPRRIQPGEDRGDHVVAVDRLLAPAPPRSSGTRRARAWLRSVRDTKSPAPITIGTRSTSAGTAPRSRISSARPLEARQALLADGWEPRMLR